MNRKILFVFLVLLCSFQKLCAQKDEANIYLQQGDICYNNGDKECAKENYRLYILFYQNNTDRVPQYVKERYEKLSNKNPINDTIKGQQINVEKDTIVRNVIMNIDNHSINVDGGDYVGRDKITNIYVTETEKEAQKERKTGEETNKYPVTYRILFPGAAQIHKDSKIKAGLIITGELVCIGGVITSYSLRSYYDNKFSQTKDPGQKQDYVNKINFYDKVLKPVSWGMFGVIYLYSFLDGWLAPGKLYYKLNETTLNLSPYISPFGNGITISLIF